MSFFRQLLALEQRTEAFWRARRAGRLECTHCIDCDYLMYPSRPICPKCRGRNLDVRQVSGYGVVHSYTVNHTAWYPGQDVPYSIALVELAEQPGLRLMTNIVNCPVTEVRIGIPVRVLFENVS